MLPFSWNSSLIVLFLIALIDRTMTSIEFIEDIFTQVLSVHSKIGPEQSNPSYLFLFSLFCQQIDNITTNQEKTTLPFQRQRDSSVLWFFLRKLLVEWHIVAICFGMDRAKDSLKFLMAH